MALFCIESNRARVERAAAIQTWKSIPSPVAFELCKGLSGCQVGREGGGGGGGFKHSEQDSQPLLNGCHR